VQISPSINRFTLFAILSEIIGEKWGKENEEKKCNNFTRQASPLSCHTIN
jgi:hypothetical protein